jgi:hypothetical protein
MPRPDARKAICPRKDKLGAVRAPGEKEFIVSLSSAVGGGRQVLFASNAKEAATRAFRNKWPRRKLAPKNLSVIVTDLSKKRNAQTFF